MRRLHIQLYLSIIAVLICFTLGIFLLWHVIDHRARTLLHGAQVILLVGAVGAGLALLAYPIARGVTARLERLKLGVRSFGSGDLSARVAVEGKDEVAALATSFNESAARIEQLVRANQMLLANCSHELRTPLTRMRLAAERLASGDAGANAELARNIGELDTLIGELLLTSRLDANKRPDRVEIVDLLALAAEEAAHFDLEVAGEPVTLRGDPLLLRRLIRNLLENARVHAGGASELRVIRGERGAQLIVEDTGPGIAAADRERIFEPFWGSPSSGRSRGCTAARSTMRRARAVAAGSPPNYRACEAGT
jgi:signal transduction histidine kinase